MPLPSRRRIRKIAIALVLLGVTAWIVPSYFSAERYRRRLETGLEQALHRPVKFGSLSFRLLPRPGFSIRDVEVGQDPEFGAEPFARVDQIDCDLRWHSLWRSQMDFAHLHLDHPSFNVVLNSRGEWNVEKLLAQSGLTATSGSGRAPLLAGQQLGLDVNDARIDFQMGFNKKPFALVDVRAQLQVSPAEHRVQFQILASPVRVDMALPTPGPVEMTGTWTPSADLSGPIDARLRTRGALLYDWIPIVTGLNRQIYGVMDSDIHLTGSLLDLIVEGETNLAQLQRWGMPPPSDPIPWNIRYRGRLTRGRERIQLDSLDASFADSHLHIAGSVEKLRSSPLVDCVVAIERSRVSDILAVVRRFWPGTGSWNARGRVDAMLAIRGPWKDRQYGGYVGVQEASLETGAGAFPISDLAVRITDKGLILAPAQISLSSHAVLTAHGAITRGATGPQYDVQLAAKGIRLRDAANFASGLGVRALKAIGASGSLTGTLRLTGSAWPPHRPVVTAHAEVRAARLLIPGLTEPLNLPRASLQVSGDQIVADPVVAVLGTSVFKARLAHHGGRNIPWTFDIHANNLNLEQGALWFDALGLRAPTPLLARIPGLGSFTARRQAASHIFDSLNASGQLAAPEVTYRGVTLRDFVGTFSLGARQIEMTQATFRAGSGRFDADGSADFTVTPPHLKAKLAVANLSLHRLFPQATPAHEIRATVGATARLETYGLGHEELADNLTGRVQVRARDISFGNFDPLDTLAQNSHWGKLESVHGPVTAPPLNLDLEIRDRRFVLKSGAIDLNGASLDVAGSYAWNGNLELKIGTDVRRLRRHWLLHEDVPLTTGVLPEVRLGGPLDHLVVNPQEVVENAGRGRGRGVR